MSNVIQLFGRKPNAPVNRGPVDVTDLVALIVDWAEAQGIDCNDPGFEIRVCDLTAQLQIMAMDSREYA